MIPYDSCLALSPLLHLEWSPVLSSCGWKCHYLILFNDWVILCCVQVPHLLYPFSVFCTWFASVPCLWHLVQLWSQGCKCLQILVFFISTPRCGIVGSYGTSMCSFFFFFFFKKHRTFWASFVAQLVKNPPAMWGTWVQSLGWEDPLEKGKATHFSILTWRIP